MYQDMYHSIGWAWSSPSLYFRRKPPKETRTLHVGKKESGNRLDLNFGNVQDRRLRQCQQWEETPSERGRAEGILIDIFPWKNKMRSVTLSFGKRPSLSVTSTAVLHHHSQLLDFSTMMAWGIGPRELIILSVGHQFRRIEPKNRLKQLSSSNCFCI